MGVQHRHYHQLVGCRPRCRKVPDQVHMDLLRMIRRYRAHKVDPQARDPVGSFGSNLPAHRPFQPSVFLPPRDDDTDEDEGGLLPPLLVTPPGQGTAQMAPPCAPRKRRPAEADLAPLFTRENFGYPFPRQSELQKQLRQQQEESPTAVPPSVQQGSSQPLRRSTRVPQQRVIQDNVYGSRNPTDVLQQSNRDWQIQLRGNPVPSQPGPQVAPDPSQQPGPSSTQRQATPPPLGRVPTPHDDKEDQDANCISYLGCPVSILTAAMAQEGGAPLINFLLAKAIPPNERDALLSTQSVRDWTFQDILWLPIVECKEWKAACHEELESLRARRVFELTDLPKGRKVVKNRWVFDVKSDSRKRAHLIAKGFSQVEGIDFNKIFSPVVRFETVRLMLALTSLEGWHMEALDVKTAFLYGKLDEEIYMHQPEGFKLKG